MNLYPVCLRLENVPCLVVGGGRVAARKIRSLLKCRAAVTVASDKLCAELKRRKDRGELIHKKSKYKKFFLEKAFLVFAATADEKVNAQIAEDCFNLKIPVNAADEPQNCSFFVPSVIRKEPLLVSISTAGDFPGMAKKLRLRLTPYISRCAKEVKKLSKLRREIKKTQQRSARSKSIKNILKRSKLPRIT